MTKRKKILFLIDVNPAVTSSSCSGPENDYFKQIRLATLRILQYFSGEHKCFGEDERYAPLWGFKFYDSSSGDQPDFRRHNFFDLKVEDFNAFEKELEAKSQTNFKPSGRRPKQERKTLIDQHLSCALSEVVSQFQWERPEFFSPAKSRSSQQKFKEAKGDAAVNSNFLFLFTPCPSCAGDVEAGALNNVGVKAINIKDNIMKKELYHEIVNVKRISLYWVDTGQYCHKVDDDFHICLMEALNHFHGSLMSFKTLASWWMIDGSNRRECVQPVPFLSLMQSSVKPAVSSVCKFDSVSSRSCSLLLRMPDTRSFGADSCDMTIPLVLHPAAVRQDEKIDVARSECNQKPLKNITSDDENVPFVGCIKFIATKCSALSLLPHFKFSYRCSVKHHDINEGVEKDSLRIVAFQQLVSILYEKQKMLMIDLENQKNGKRYDACLYPVTYNSANLSVLGIGSSLFKGSLPKKYSAGYLLDELESRISFLRSNCPNSQFERQKTATPSGTKEALFAKSQEMNENPPHTSLMQWQDYWFYYAPSQPLSLSFHQQLKQTVRESTTNRHKSDYTTNMLLSKLKDCYKINDRNIEKTQSSTFRHSHRRRLGSGASSTKNTVKISARNGKSDDDIDSNVVQTRRNSADFEENGSNTQQVDGEVKEEGDEETAGLFLSQEEISAHLTDRITAVLQQDLKSCESASVGISKTLCNGLKQIKKQGNSLDVNPAECLRAIFKKIEVLHSNEEQEQICKKMQLKRHLLHALLQLDIAVLVDCSNDEEEVSEKVISLFRRVMFLEDPSYLSKYLNDVIYPRYEAKIGGILFSIYEGLAQDPPSELLARFKRKSDEDECFESNEAPSSVNYNFSLNNSTVGRFRRFSSIGEGMVNRRQIVVPIKKHKETKKVEKNPTGVGSSKDELAKEGWCRNLFQNENFSVAHKGSRKRKLQRRHSEFASIITNTPVMKQRRHSIWKRQHWERKRDEAITDVTVIEESPLKNRSPSAETNSNNRTDDVVKSQKSNFYLLKTPTKSPLGSSNVRDEFDQDGLDKDNIESSYPGRNLTSSFSDLSWLSKRCGKGRGRPRLAMESSSRPRPAIETSTTTDKPFCKNTGNNPLLYSEDSMDWVSMFEKEKPDQPCQPSSVDTPLNITDTLLKTSDVWDGLSRDTQQAPSFSSPSVSSLEVLENAPILSPRLVEAKEKRSSSCRKRIDIFSSLCKKDD